MDSNTISLAAALKAFLGEPKFTPAEFKALTNDDKAWLRAALRAAGYNVSDAAAV